MPATCPTCGATYADGYTFCATDGTPLVRAAAPPPQPQAASSGSRNVLLGVLGSLTFLLACIVVVMLVVQTNAAPAPEATDTGASGVEIATASGGGSASGEIPRPRDEPQEPEVEPLPPEPTVRPLPPPRQRPRAASSGPARVNTDPTGLLLRSGPGRSYGVLGKMQPGEVVSVSSCDTDASGQRWCQVTYGGITGYAGGEFLQIGAPSSDTNSRLEQAFGAAAFINASAVIDGAKVDYINVRKTPSTSGAVDLRLRPGAAITVMRCLPNGWTLGGRGITGRWCFINADVQDGRSISGWASDGALVW